MNGKVSKNFDLSSLNFHPGFDGQSGTRCDLYDIAYGYDITRFPDCIVSDNH